MIGIEHPDGSVKPDRTISVVVAHDHGLLGPWVTDHILPDAGIVVADVADSLSPVANEVQTSKADVLVVACSSDFDEALGLVEWWVAHHAGRPVIVLCPSHSDGFVQRAFTAGADDLVVLEPGPDVSAASSQHVVFALQKAMARKLTPAENGTTGATMICVLGPKGGVGKTVTTCNLAVSLAGRSKRVVLVDVDLQFGDVALSLGLRPESTAYDLAISGGSLDAEKLDAFLMTHPTGLRVLAAPLRPDQTGVVTAEFMADVIAALRDQYEYVIVDTPPTFTPEVIAMIDSSTYVCMVGMLDALSLKNTRLGLETLDLMGYPADGIRLVLNRANSSVGITGRDVVTILGRSPDILVPSSREIPRSVNQGEPIVLSQSRSEPAKAFNALAELFYLPTSAAAAGKRRRTRLGRRGD
jgi:pilus assembly protein CpaE